MIDARSPRAMRGAAAVACVGTILPLCLMATFCPLATLGLTAATLSCALPAHAADSAASSGPPARVEAHSEDLVAVGLVHDDRMIIHLSRVIDNAPIRDAVVTVALRGTVHPTTSEADGSYSLQTKDLALPGSAAVEFQVAGPAAGAGASASGGGTAGNSAAGGFAVGSPGGGETLKGMLQVTGAAGPSEDRNSSRQLWWWVLNFGVCIGFLMLISRRRKAAKD